YKFVYYWLKNSYYKLRSLSSGIRNNLNTEDIKKFEINLPSLPTQQKIAAILSSLDDKIALNKKINAKLEAMAKRLYDYWFVQFDFPNEEGKPYKSSGGKMEYNATLKRDIPEGWEVKSVNDISVSYRGVGYTADDEKSAEDNDVVLILRGNNISNNHIIYDGNTVYLDKSFVSEEQKIHKYDFVMTMSSGSKEHVGKSAMFLFDSPHSYGAFCNKITPARDCQFFLENYLHSEYFKKYIQITCSGTGINNLTNEHFDKAFFPFPDNEVLESFNQKINPIYEQIGVLEKENLRLMELRDKLLPLLMNGQVEVV
ncbi:MAG: restriction endonuclease subunit S, partial [Treponema sp.]|nr:restriction endonuclease subunit S [Treponema sp.]